LRFAVHPSGKKTFNLYKKFHPTRGPITFPLGQFPEVSVEQARREATDKIAMMARGINPRDALKPSGDPTLGDFFEQRYLREYLGAKPAAQRGARRTFDRYLAPLQNRPLSQVTRADVERLHRHVARPVLVEDPKTKKKKSEHGPVAANRLLALVSSIFTKARDWGVHHGDNPARGVQKISEHPRTRLLGRNGELAAFRQALDRETDRDLRLYLMLRLYNGVRERNILAMRWADVDLGQGTWHIGETKNGDPLLVPLATPTVKELRARAKAIADGKNSSEFVFPGRRVGAHLNTINKRWWRFRASLGFNDLQLRDLRRTFGSRALAAGVPMDVIGQAMGHKPGSKITASVYALADEQLKREAVIATTKKMLAEAVDETQKAIRA
jgi:integrase